MIRELPYETLYQVYQDSIKYSLDAEFIEMLEQELKRRENRTASVTPKLNFSIQELAGRR